MSVKITSIGLDIAKDVFQVHATDRDGNCVLARRLRRAEMMDFFARHKACIVGIEACNTAHHWGRSLASLGHDVRLIHPSYVRPFVKRGKTDALDAQAINEAVLQKNMRFVSVKSVEQQATTMIFRTRQLMIRQRVQTSNALRNHLAELGIVANVGMSSLKRLVALVRGEEGQRLPEAALAALEPIVEQIDNLSNRIDVLNKQITTLAQRDTDMQRLMTIPGIGPITAAAIKTAVQDPHAFRTARHFAAWLGLTPRIHASGEATFLGRITKMGDRKLRSLLVGGATAALRVANEDSALGRWLLRLRRRRPFKVVAVALANKMARIAWALLVKGGIYNPTSLTTN